MPSADTPLPLLNHNPRRAVVEQAGASPVAPKLAEVGTAAAALLKGSGVNGIK